MNTPGSNLYTNMILENVIDQGFPTFLRSLPLGYPVLSTRTTLPEQLI